MGIRPPKQRKDGRDSSQNPSNIQPFSFERISKFVLNAPPCRFHVNASTTGPKKIKAKQNHLALNEKQPNKKPESMFQPAYICNLVPT